MGLANSVTYHNSSSIDIGPWLSEGDLPNSSTGGKTCPMLQLKNFVPPDYRRPSLEIHREHGNLIQLILGGNLWRCRPLLTASNVAAGGDPEILQTLEAFPLLVTARSAAAS